MSDSQAARTKVLIIEDNLVLREGLSSVLRQRGFDTYTAANGAIGLALIAAIQPDVILLDMLMPVMDGWKFLDTFRCSDFKHIPVICATAVGLGLDWAREHGCRGVLKKPFDADAVLAEIGRVLPGASAWTTPPEGP